MPVTGLMRSPSNPITEVHMSNPICLYRGQLMGVGRWHCEHPKVYLPDGVSATSCRVCMDRREYYRPRLAQADYAPPPKARQSNIWQPLPVCEHRGTEVIALVTCELCGGRTMSLPVYKCEVHGQCTERRYGSRTEKSRETASCAGCEQYSVPDAAVK